MNLKVDDAKEHRTIMRSALLTTGFGPIVKCAYKALIKYTDLHAVVFQKKVSSKWKKFKVYGIRFTLQYLISRVIYTMTGNTNIRSLLPAELGVRIWKSKQDRDNIKEWLKNRNIDVVFICDFPSILPKEFLIQIEKLCPL